MKTTGKAGSKGATRPTSRPKLLVDDVTAILLVSRNPKRLCEFYRVTLGLPLEEEVQEDLSQHYLCALGHVQVAIRPSDGSRGVPTRNAQSPIISFSTSQLKAVAKRLSSRGVKVKGPASHGFADVISFRDPDGNRVSVLEYRSE